jgi:hypothetical protein
MGFHQMETVIGLGCRHDLCGRTLPHNGQIFMARKHIDNVGGPRARTLQYLQHGLFGIANYAIDIGYKLLYGGAMAQVLMTVSIPPELREQVRQQAQAENRNLSNMVAELLRIAIVEKNKAA